MIIWSGKGFFCVMFLLLGIAATQGSIEMFTGQKPAQQNHDFMWAASFSIAAIANFFLVRYLNNRPKRMVIDKATGEEFELSDHGALFFIPTKWWTHIFAGLAVIFLIRFFWP